jgi:hypothetical protein
MTKRVRTFQYKFKSFTFISKIVFHGYQLVGLSIESSMASCNLN